MYLVIIVIVFRVSWIENTAKDGASFASSKLSKLFALKECSPERTASSFQSAVQNFSLMISYQL